MKEPVFGTISFACDGCGKGFTVPATLAGRKATCKSCGLSILVPARGKAPGPVPPAQRPVRGRAGLPQPPARPMSRAPTPPLEPPTSIDPNKEIDLTSSGADELLETILGSPPAPTIEITDRGSAGRRRSRGNSAGRSRPLAVAIVAILVAVGLGLGAVTVIPSFFKRVGNVARTAVRTVPIVRALAAGRVIKQEEVDEVLNQASINDVSSRNVNQQLVC